MRRRLPSNVMFHNKFLPFWPSGTEEDSLAFGHSVALKMITFLFGHHRHHHYQQWPKGFLFFFPTISHGGTILRPIISKSIARAKRKYNQTNEIVQQPFRGEEGGNHDRCFLFECFFVLSLLLSRLFDRLLQPKLDHIEFFK